MPLVERASDGGASPALVAACETLGVLIHGETERRATERADEDDASEARETAKEGARDGARATGAGEKSRARGRAVRRRRRKRARRGRDGRWGSATTVDGARRGGGATTGDRGGDL